MTVVGDNGGVISNTIAPSSEADTRQETKADSNMFDDLDTKSEIKTDTKSKEDLDAARLPGRISSITEERVKINTDTYTPDDLEITPAEKAAFIEAMVTGERYRQTFSIFNGKITVTLRSRIAAETHALYSYIRHMMAGGRNNISVIEGDMAYVPLVAQVEELNGVKYPEMKTPLTFEESDGKEVQPGWYEDFKAWKAKPEGLTSALISCIQLFEYKYWTMTREATNKNFWNSDTSTVK